MLEDGVAGTIEWDPICVYACTSANKFKCVAPVAL